jgi:hypothetical protein
MDSEHVASLHQFLTFHAFVIGRAEGDVRASPRHVARVGQLACQFVMMSVSASNCSIHASTSCCSAPSGTEARDAETNSWTARAGNWSKMAPPGEWSSTMTTAAPSVSRQGQTWTSPSPVGSKCPFRISPRQLV